MTYPYPQPPQAPTVAVAKRIPGHLPFLVRPEPGKVIRSAALVLGIPYGLLTTGSVVLAITSDGSDNGWSGALGVIGIFTALWAALLALVLWNRLRGGPRFGADASGLYILVRPSKAIWLAWNQTAGLRIGRYGWTKMLCVDTNNHQAQAAAAPPVQNWAMAIYARQAGTELRYLLKDGDHDYPQVAEAVYRWSQGTVHAQRS